MARGRKFLKVTAGFLLLLLGVPLLFLPGPGALTIAMGLAILAAEYVWAQRLLGQMRTYGARLRGVWSTGPTDK